MNIPALCALSFAIGIVAGLRALTAPAAVAWSSRLGWAAFRGTWAAFLTSRWALVILTALALFELYNDKRPGTPSRKAPPSFAIRILLGGFSGAALCAATGASALMGVALGAAGAVTGTLIGYQARTWTVRAWHVPDFPVALIEDALAVAGGLLVASRLG